MPASSDNVLLAGAMRAITLLFSLLGLLAGLSTWASPSSSQTTRDWITGAPREAMPIKAWPDGKKVAICFVLYVEVWGKGQGPNFRPDMTARNPDVVDEAFRQYAIEWGVPRVGRLFKDQGVPLSIALNAQFPEQHPEIWKQFRASVPKASIVAHGINNSTEMLPLDKGMDAQKAYIKRTLDMIEKSTGVRSRGWSSPSVFPNVDTYAATAAEGIKYSLDGMDSDVLVRLMTSAGPLVMIPYPAADRGHGPLPVAHEGVGRPRAPVDRLRERAGARGRTRSRPACNCRGDRGASLRHRHAGRRRLLPTRARGAEGAAAGLAHRHRRRHDRGGPEALAACHLSSWSEAR